MENGQFPGFTDGLTKKAEKSIEVENPVFARSVAHNRREVVSFLDPLKMINLDRGLGAVGYYRTVIPFYYLRRMGLGTTFMAEEIYKGSDLEEGMARMSSALEWSDIVQINRPYGTESLTFIKSVKARGKLAVVDTDDNLEMVQTTGHTFLKKFWSDSRVRFYVIGLEHADLITVASKYLFTEYNARWPGKVAYLPNPVDSCSGRWNFPHSKTEGRDVTICWYAGSSHKKDEDLIEEAVLEILARYPGVTFQTIGYKPRFCQRITNGQWKHIEGSKYNEFVSDLGGVDICLAPLVPHEFNQGRSDTKIFEPTMAGCAVIASPVGEYLDWRDKVLLAESGDEWVDSMTRLIEDTELRNKLNEEAVSYVLAEREAGVVIPKWHDQLRGALHAKLRAS